MRVDVTADEKILRQLLLLSLTLMMLLLMTLLTLARSCCDVREQSIAVRRSQRVEGYNYENENDEQFWKESWSGYPDTDSARKTPSETVLEAASDLRIRTLNK